MADIAGGYGVSFLIVFANAALAACIGAGREGLRKALAGVAAAGLLVALSAGYGVWRMADVAARFDPVPERTVALVQGNIDQSIKWDPSFQKETLRIYRDLSREAAASGVRFVIWPETATPFMFQSRDELHDAVVGTARATGAWRDSGTPSYTRHDGALR